jgi:predicted transposase YbfD/YdcC
MAMVEPQRLAQVFLSLASDALSRFRGKRSPGRPRGDAEPEPVTIDGKTEAGVVPRGGSKSHTHIVNAVMGLVTMAAQCVADKSNEMIKAIPMVLDLLAKHGLPKGRRVSTDAMGRQRAIAAKIVGCGASRLFSLKGSQSSLHKYIIKLFKAALRPGNKDAFLTRTFSRPADKAGGRVEERPMAMIALDGAAISSLDPGPRQTLDLTVARSCVEPMRDILDRFPRRGRLQGLEGRRGLVLMATVLVKYRRGGESVARILNALEDWDRLMECLTMEPGNFRSSAWWMRRSERELQASLVPKPPLSKAA